MFFMQSSRTLPGVLSPALAEAMWWTFPDCRRRRKYSDLAALAGVLPVIARAAPAAAHAVPPAGPLRAGVVPIAVQEGFLDPILVPCVTRTQMVTLRLAHCAGVQAWSSAGDALRDRRQGDRR
ncbi:MAG: hypothetical protein IT495_12200 [Gammaproteobacteria bacterium]|nr:hypothetical protein [Gammaproteobacteria bacterium]